MKTYFLCCLGLCVSLIACAAEEKLDFHADKDLIALHYDHAADKDDGHSAAADRTILETLKGLDWVKSHVLAVSGAYGLNGPTFVKKSDAVMDACWNDAGGWLAAHDDRDKALAAMTERWLVTLKAGGDVWVKEGGQSDLTAEVVKRLIKLMPDLEPKKRIHVVQHSKWNEDKTTPEALNFTKANTDYINIKDANTHLNTRKGNPDFAKTAIANPKFGQAWKAAFDYYPATQRVDFSDTGELMYILGLGQMKVEDFRKRFLGGS